MTALILVVHVVLAVVLIGVILLQRSEGGALGIGGGGGFMSGRGAANLLTRTTAVLAALFLGTSLILAILAGTNIRPQGSILDAPAPTPAAPSTATPAIPAAPPAEPAAPSVPVSK